MDWIGWYSDRRHEITDILTTGHTVRLHAFVDHEKMSDGNVIILKVGDYYIYAGETNGTVVTGASETGDELMGADVTGADAT